MAHWIIEDHGFGGAWYKCSDCRESWYDIFNDVSMEETCPMCGAVINEEEPEYIEEKKKPAVPFNLATIINNRVADVHAHKTYEENEQKLIALTGFGIEKLIDLFAAGYTLQPPTQMRLEDLLSEEQNQNGGTK
jgi:hypothetical protein